MKRLAVFPLLAGCASPPVEIPGNTGGNFDVAESEVPASLAMGFDSLDPDTGALQGDRVLLAVRLRSGAEQRLRYVRVTRTGPPAERSRAGAFSIHDDNLSYSIQWTTSRSPLTIEIFGSEGQLLATHDREARTFTTIEQDALIANAPRMMAPLLDVVRDTPELESFLQDVIQRPSMLSILQHGGVRIAVGTDMGSEFVTHPDHQGSESYGDRLVLLANDELALDMRVLHTWRQSPLLLAAGIVRLEAYHPTEEGHRVTIEVLGAERGR